MIEVKELGYDQTLINMTMEYSLLEAVSISLMILFIIWNIKLVMEPVKEKVAKVAAEEKCSKKLQGVMIDVKN